ncbi:MAG: excinuclease [Kurthia sp.]|nr:excinuclease [Candidatus Kurthia equi]
MNKRFKITRLNEQGEPTLTLEECQEVFATFEGFKYQDSFTATSKEGVGMTLKGDFFMWTFGDTQIPFRFFGGEVYVAISKPEILHKAIAIADVLKATYVEG